MKVMSIVGARPQFIKAFAVSRELRPEHEEILVHTGQHYDEELSDVFFEELDIPEPDYNLSVGSGSHGEQTAAMLSGIESIVEKENPNVVLLYGDTNSTLAGAIAAVKLEPLVAHVEAGLRSYNREMPEEINRVLTDHASDLLFAPSESAAKTLEKEGITDGVHVVGDVMYDAILWAREVAKTRSNILSRLDLTPDEYVLSTVHRAGNTDNPKRLEGIINGLSESECRIIFPVHPRTKNRLQKYGLWKDATEELTTIDPVGYLDFVSLLANCTQIVTDSGGIQKEAFFLNKPCITIREETEWVETVECGWNSLASADPSTIQIELDSTDQPDSKPDLYGDGNAAAALVTILNEKV